MKIETLEDFFKREANKWDVIQKNYVELQGIKKKEFDIGGFKGIIQYNPARSVSTLASVEKKSIARRPCFLCEKNRVKEQSSIEIIPEWELLVNPFPILPMHFTISNKRHIPQQLDISAGKMLAKELPGMVIFYNSPEAGASAPDHRHFQAVKIQDVPLISLIENFENSKVNLKDFPFTIITDPEEIKEDDKMNAYFWHSTKTKEIKFLAIKRKLHRPKEYYLTPPNRRAVSPGALDMAGIIVVPIEEDYNRITSYDIKKIYHQVAE